MSDPDGHVGIGHYDENEICGCVVVEIEIVFGGGESEIASFFDDSNEIEIENEIFYEKMTLLSVFSFDEQENEMKIDLHEAFFFVM